MNPNNWLENARTENSPFDFIIAFLSDEHARQISSFCFDLKIFQTSGFSQASAPAWYRQASAVGINIRFLIKTCHVVIS